MTSVAYRDLLARNVRAARAAAQIGQQELARRMRALGFDAWLHQTVGNVERGKRRLTAEEVLGLALALEVTMANLLLPDPEDEPVALPSGDEIHATGVIRLIFSAGMSRGLRPVTWEDGKPVVAPVFMVRGAPYPSRAEIAKRIGEDDR